MLETGTLVEGVESLASYDWAYVWLADADAYDTMGDTFLRIITLVVVTLLAVYLRYRLYF